MKKKLISLWRAIRFRMICLNGPDRKPRTPPSPFQEMYPSSSLKLLCALSIFFFTPSLSIPFLPANNVSLFGDAFLNNNNSISLTKHKNCTPPPPPPPPTSLSGVGRAFYINPVRFLDLSTNTTASFFCSFSFTIANTPSCPFGDGLTFLITSNINSFTLNDGYFGLPAETEDSSEIQDFYFAVEFDTSFDPNLEDINDKMIRVWIGYSNQIRPENPVLVVKVDLSEKFKEFMHIGFTASNGKGSSIHTVDHWRFKTFFGFVPSTMPMDTVESGDCLMCYPGDTDIDISSFDYHRSNRRVLNLAMVLGGFLVLTVIIASVVVGFVCLNRKRRLRKTRSERHMRTFQGGTMVPEMLSLNEIKSATNGFNSDKIIGEGASAVVYEGNIRNCGAVAVKRFIQENKVGSSTSRIPFNTEFATMAGCLKHKNLVQLQGWCCEKNELVLVYEYMANGSLDKILHNRTNLTKFLTWERRLNIILGVASALIYLHEECESQIIHRDVKTCNILLDSEFNAKLGDFGLAEVYRHSFVLWKYIGYAFCSFAGSDFVMHACCVASDGLKYGYHGDMPGRDSLDGYVSYKEMLNVLRTVEDCCGRLDFDELKTIAGF
ncbi:hypothetical protein DH2020_047478 [Rehmannia glutinosa]|uniref:Protein kinase domain-containing protein n=1 Tax=Rehmannia glutinosa TaxID=99300 RepID=A0ABR0U8Q2_REHGL